MSSLDQLVNNFLACKHIAIVGISDKRDTGCNLTFNRFRDAGYRVTPVNPRITTFQGQPCYPDILSIPEKPDAIFVMTNPRITKEIVHQAAELGVSHIWMHCMMGVRPGLGAGTSSVSQEAVALCKEKGIEVIPGSCPNQFLNPDFAHAFMRKLWGLFGYLKME